jgi:hypothetical protein
MGAVEMGEGGTYKFDGASITQIEYCVYCDKCGSFKISKAFTSKNWLWISITVVISTIVWYSARDGALPGAWLMCFCSTLLMVYFLGGINLGLRCRKCGNRNISKRNVLSYPANDRSILDVPLQSTVRYYQDDY